MGRFLYLIALVDIDWKAQLKQRVWYLTGKCLMDYRGAGGRRGKTGNSSSSKSSQYTVAEAIRFYFVALVR